MIYEFLFFWVVFSSFFGMLIFLSLFDYKCVMNGYYYRVIELKQRKKEIRQKELLAKKQKRLARKLRTDIPNIS